MYLARSGFPLWQANNSRNSKRRPTNPVLSTWARNPPSSISSLVASFGSQARCLRLASLRTSFWDEHETRRSRFWGRVRQILRRGPAVANGLREDNALAWRVADADTTCIVLSVYTRYPYGRNYLLLFGVRRVSSTCQHLSSATQSSVWEAFGLGNMPVAWDQPRLQRTTTAACPSSD